MFSKNTSFTSYLKNIFIFLIIFIVFLELGIRGIQIYLLSKESNQYEQYKEIYSDEREKDYLYWHKPNIKVKLENGHYDFTFITNKYGHRSLSDNINFEESIIFLGDSIIEGASLENNETISSLVGDHLDISTINLGLGSANTVHEYYLLKDKLKSSMNMKLLILGICLNDIKGNSARVFFNPEIGNWEYYDNVIVDKINLKHSFDSNFEKNLSFLKFYLKKSEAIFFLYRLYGNTISLLSFKKSNNKNEKSSSLNEYQFLHTEYFINLIHNFVAENNSKMLVVLFPNRNQIKLQEPLDVQESLKEILKRNNIPFFDPFDDLLLNKQMNSNDPLFHDDIHPNALGAKIIAKSLSEYIKSNYGSEFSQIK